MSERLSHMLLIDGEPHGYYASRQLAVAEAGIQAEAIRLHAKGEYQDEPSIYVAEITDEWSLVTMPVEKDDGTFTDYSDLRKTR